MKKKTVSIIATALMVFGAMPALSQGYVAPKNAKPKCLKKGTALSGAEYYIHPLLNFSYDVEMTYKMGSNDFPINLTIVKSIRKNKGVPGATLKIARANPPQNIENKIDVTFDRFKANGFLLILNIRPISPNDDGGQIAAAIWRGEKVKVAEGAKAVQISLDTAKMAKDFQSIEGEMKKMLEDEKAGLCRNVYDFQE